MDGVTAIFAGPRKRAFNPRRLLRKIGFWLSVVVIVSPAILVFLWMLSLSLKNELDNSTYPPVFIPNPPTLGNYVQVFTENAMGLLFRQQPHRLGMRHAALRWQSGFRPASASRGLAAHKTTVLILIASLTPG